MDEQDVDGCAFPMTENINSGEMAAEERGKGRNAEARMLKTKEQSHPRRSRRTLTKAPPRHLSDLSLSLSLALPRIYANRHPRGRLLTFSSSRSLPFLSPLMFAGPPHHPRLIPFAYPLPIHLRDDDDDDDDDEVQTAKPGVTVYPDARVPALTRRVHFPRFPRPFFLADVREGNPCAACALGSPPVSLKGKKGKTGDTSSMCPKGVSLPRGRERGRD